MLAPSLETDRLVLAAHREADLPEYIGMWGDPVVTRHIGGRPFSAEECWHRLLRGVGHWAIRGYGYWVAREKASGRLVGEVGFADLRRDLDPPLGDTPEMGWVLARWAHGQGFGTEAVRGALAWALETWGPRRMCCIIAPENVASLRIAEKVGFREVARTTYHDAPTVVFERAAGVA